jgi:hypothetical protein
MTKIIETAPRTRTDIRWWRVGRTFLTTCQGVAPRDHIV